MMTHMNPLESVAIRCPYCGEDVDVSVETTADRRQSLIEDCPVCCRPMHLQVCIDDTDAVAVYATREDA
jgi:uncharacterized Zn finger protein